MKEKGILKNMLKYVIEIFFYYLKLIVGWFLLFDEYS